MATIIENLHNRAPLLIEKLGFLINPLLLNFKNEKNQLLIFCFHGLFESEKQRKLNHIDPQNNMTVKQFSEFIEYFLNHRYKFITYEHLSPALKEDQPYAMITFDDGYFNNIMAFEILKKFKIPAVFFITTKNARENKSYWWDIIYKYRIKNGTSVDSIRSEQRSLKNFKYTYIDNYILQNFGAESFTPWSDIDRPLSLEEIRELAVSPYVAIGNHSHNHAILTNYDKDEIREELRESSRILTDLTGKVPVSAAFPNGNFNNLVLEATEEAGIKYAFTTNPKQNLLPMEQKNLICLDRYMTNTTKVRRYGGFCRLGYEPEVLYSGLRSRLRSIILGNV